MKAKELKDKKIEEMQKILEDSREKVREYRFKVASRQQKDVRDIRKEKKLIARILTILNQKKDK